MFRSHKYHGQVCMLLHVNSYAAGTLIVGYALNSFFFGATAPIWALAYLHETVRLNSLIFQKLIIFMMLKI
jgi:hypothetical protein